MSKRLIGIEIGYTTLRVAILTQDKGQISIGSLLARDYAAPGELAEQLKGILAGEFRIGDQLVTCLPARSAYVRRLEFPFQDEKKIAAAVPFSLSAQLPTAIDRCAIASQPAQSNGTGAKVSTAAVPAETLLTLLAAFEEAGLPLHCVDLAPFCYAAGVGEQIGDGLLLCATDQETTVSLIQQGCLADYRILPTMTGPEDRSLRRQLLREIRVLQQAAGGASQAIGMIGEAATPELQEALQASGLRVEMLALQLGEQKVDSLFLPAVALALRARLSRHSQAFNFRQGHYALKGEWANLKRKLALLTTLLAMSVLVMIGSMTLKYVDEARRADQLQLEMVKIYKSLFPEATTIIDVPLQLKSAIHDLQQAGSFITDSRASALAVLKEISRMPEAASVEIQEFSLGAEELKLTGWAASFESVNQVARLLGESAMFAKAQVTDAKMSLDGRRIDFRLLLSLANPGAER